MKEYKGYYVTKEGKVYNKFNKELGYNDSKGYKRFDIAKDNKRQQYQIHRFVWEAFNGPIPEDKVVDHINENPQDNRLDNLQLLERGENSSKSLKFSVTEEQRDYIKNQATKGVAYNKIAAKIGCSTNTIFKIVNELYKY